MGLQASFFRTVMIGKDPVPLTMGRLSKAVTTDVDQSMNFPIPFLNHNFRLTLEVNHHAKGFVIASLVTVVIGEISVESVDSWGDAG